MRFSKKCLLGFILLLFTCLITVSNIFAKQIQVQAGISIYPDPRSAPNVYVEFPFAVKRCNLSFLPEDSVGSSLITGIYAELVLMDTLGNTIDSSSTYFLTRAADTTDAMDSDVKLFNRLNMMINPGIYSAKLSVIDAVSKDEGAFFYNRLEIDSVDKDNLKVSSLEFAHGITVAEDNESKGNVRLMKNGRLVIPNPMAVFSVDDSIIYIYAEIYNLAFGTDQNDTLILNYQICAEDGSLIYDFGEMLHPKPGASAVISNALKLDDYEPGRYELKLIADDYGSGQIDTSSARFIIYPKTGELPQFASQPNISHPYDTAGVETKLRLVKFLMAPQQMEMLQSLNETGKVRFIDQYFADKDSDPLKEGNDFLDDVFRRYVYSNEYYSTLPAINDGWNTDRGRVMLQYGFFDTIDEVLAPAYGRPWEKWTYYQLQGGVFFVFQDIRGYGDYKLVHSTASGEIYNSDWQNVLKDNEPLLME